MLTETSIKQVDKCRKINITMTRTLFIFTLLLLSSMTVVTKAAYPQVKRSMTEVPFGKRTKDAGYKTNQMMNDDPNSLLGFWGLY